MFNCYAHNWSHIVNPCPMCHPMETRTIDSTEFYISPPPKKTIEGHWISNHKYEELEAKVSELEAKLEKAKGFIRAIENSELPELAKHLARTALAEIEGVGK